MASAIGGGGAPLVPTGRKVPAIMEDYTILCKNYNNFVSDCFINNWFNTLLAYEDADDAYAGAWWDDPRFEVLREFFDNNGFPYELWNEGKFSDTFPYLLEYRYGIPALEFENKTLPEIIEYLYSGWGEVLNLPVMQRSEWHANSLVGDYDYHVNQSTIDMVYYFYSDHLGSASIITEGRYSDVYQALAYMPFGETLINLRNGDYDESYKFTGYERDAETGFHYAHARYYDENLGFISVDPLAERRPWLTGYHYCSNNPINRIDPTGLYDTEQEASKAQQKATLQFGNKRVGDVYNSGTEDNPNYKFQIFGAGKTKETDSYRLPSGEVTVSAYAPDISVSNDGEYNKYKKDHTTIKLGINFSVGAQFGWRFNIAGKRRGFVGNINSLSLLEGNVNKTGTNPIAFDGYIFDERNIRGSAGTTLPFLSYDYSYEANRETIKNGSGVHSFDFLFRHMGTDGSDGVKVGLGIDVRCVLGVDIYLERIVK